MSQKRCVLRSILFILVLSLLLPAVKAFSQDVIVLKLILNAEEIGEFFLVLTPEGDVWIKREDLEGTRLEKGLGQDVVFEGEAYVSLSSIPYIDFAVNEKEVSLEINAPPELFVDQALDFSYVKPYEVFYTRDDSAFLNYGVLYSSENSSFDLSAEAGLRKGDYLGISTFNYRRSDDENRLVRLLTFLRTDSRETLRTYQLGDLTASSGVLGSTLVLGGISLTKNFSIDPYFIRFPSLTLGGTLLTPSEVDVYIDDVLVRQERLQPGNFLLQDIPANIGLGSARVVIKDAFGEERVISRPFFYSDRLLKQGLHEFNYALGFLREELGTDNLSYGRAALLAFHNYGFLRGFKAGYTLEASDNLISLGPTASLILSNYGVLDAALAMSASDGETGLGGFLGYFFRSKHINAALSMSSLSQNFSNLAIRPSDDKPSFELTGAVGLTTRTLGSISAEYSTTRLHTGPDTTRYGLVYNRVITSRATFFATVSRTELEDDDDVDEVFAGLHIYFGRNTSGSLTYNKRDGETVKTATVRKNLPVGTGMGFRAQVVDFEQTTDKFADIEYQNDYGIFSAGYRDVADKESYILTASGGIGYIGSAFMSRPITDSFARVKVGEVEGVRAYYFGNEVGRTDEKGEVIIPIIRSFRDNRIDIEKDDIPIDYNIPTLTQYVNPPFRGASLVSFDVAKVQGLVGSVYVMVEGEKRAVEFTNMLITVKERTVEGLVGRGGEFYAENVPAGKYPAKVFYDGKGCIFDIIIPETDEIWVDLGEVRCEIEEGS